MEDLKTEFWKRLDSVRAAMLGVEGGTLVAMSPQLDDKHPGVIWFITARGTDLQCATTHGPQKARLVVSDDKAGLYADVKGTLERSGDHETLEDIWSFVASAWFDGGQEDPDVCLLRFTPGSAEISISEGGAVRFLYEIAKANLTGGKPDAGAQGSVSFSAH